MVVKIIIEMVRMKLAGLEEGIGSLIEDLEEPLESVELRMNIVCEPRHAKAMGTQAIETFRMYIQVQPFHLQHLLMVIHLRYSSSFISLLEYIFIWFLDLLGIQVLGDLVKLERLM